MKNKISTPFIENLFLGKKYKKILLYLYALIILIVFFYFAGKACGNLFYYFNR